MNENEFSIVLRASMERNGLPEPNEKQVKQFYDYHQALVIANQSLNLTAIRDEAEIIDKHYVDSAYAAQFLPDSGTVLDIGCGGGFPCVPLAILRPDLHFIGLDSTEKKINFVKAATAEASIQNITLMPGRAEGKATREQIGKVDAVVSRAVAQLNILSELCIPYLKICGIFLPLKGSKGFEELEQAKSAILTLGAKIESKKSYHLLTEVAEEGRFLAIIRKTKDTPSIYPRNYSQIIKKPL